VLRTGVGAINEFELSRAIAENRQCRPVMSAGNCSSYEPISQEASRVASGYQGALYARWRRGFLGHQADLDGLLARPST
jgi:hypothetical protein